VRQATVYIDSQALQYNLNRVKQLAPNAKIVSMVKANAYGHGIERVYESFKTADGFALLDIEEAKRLRALGWTGPILLLEGIFSPQDLFDCVQYQLSFTIHNEQQVEWVQQHIYPAQFDIFLKMNSGMNRLGFKPQQYHKVWQHLQRHLR
jgi:alanine racemase